MNLKYCFSEVYGCFCYVADTNNKIKIFVDNSKNEPLFKKIEKRTYFDEHEREHIKTVIHCDKCNLAFGNYKNKI